MVCDGKGFDVEQTRGPHQKLQFYPNFKLFLVSLLLRCQPKMSQPPTQSMPPKKRRRVKSSTLLVEDDDEAIDMVTFESVSSTIQHGQRSRRLEVLLRPMGSTERRHTPDREHCSE